MSLEVRYSTKQWVVPMDESVGPRSDFPVTSCLRGPFPDAFDPPFHGLDKSGQSIACHCLGANSWGSTHEPDACVAAAGAGLAMWTKLFQPVANSSAVRQTQQ